MKYRPDFPALFGSLADARAHCQTFFTWYNTEHRHSGIGYMTPSSVHDMARRSPLVRSDRTRWTPPSWPTPSASRGAAPNPPALPTAAWINPTRNGANRRLEHPGFHSKFMKHGDAKSLTRSGRIIGSDNKSRSRTQPEQRQRRVSRHIARFRDFQEYLGAKVNGIRSCIGRTATQDRRKGLARRVGPH